MGGVEMVGVTAVPQVAVAMAAAARVVVVMAEGLEAAREVVGLVEEREEGQVAAG